jgi:hypothetical protein
MFGKKYCNRCSRYMRQTKYIDFINCNKKNGKNEICEIMYKPVAVYDYFRFLCDKPEEFLIGEKCIFIPSQYVLSSTQICISKLQESELGQDRYLVCGVSKTNEGAPYDTQFGISGKVKVGESMIQGAIRETAEELHCIFKEDDFQEIYSESNSQKCVSHYMIDLDRTSPTKSEPIGSSELILDTSHLDDTSRRIIVFVIGSQDQLLQYFIPMTSSELLGIDCIKIKNLGIHFESHCSFYNNKFTF